MANDSPRFVNAATRILANVPKALRAEPRWLLWDSRRRDGRLTKVPRARVNDASTWTTFKRVRAMHAAGAGSGVGFVLGDGWGGADLDHCRDLDTGTLLADAARLLQNLNGAYVEISPSGTGVKAIFRSSRIGFENNYAKEPPAVTVWRGARYFAVTGCEAYGDPTVNCEEQLSALLPEERIEQPQSTGKGWEGATTATDHDLLIRAAGADNGERFVSLWRGEMDAYGGDHSRADLALCSILGFWCSYDADRVDGLFRLSNLMRDKWNRSSYRRSVLQRACGV